MTLHEQKPDMLPWSDHVTNRKQLVACIAGHAHHQESLHRCHGWQHMLSTLSTFVQFVVALGDKVAPTDIEEGMRVGYALFYPLAQPSWKLSRVCEMLILAPAACLRQIETGHCLRLVESHLNKSADCRGTGCCLGSSLELCTFVWNMHA